KEERQSIHRVPEEPAMSVVEKVPRKSVGPSQAGVLRSRLVAAGAAVCSAQVPQRPRPEAADVAKAVPNENLVLFAEMMIEANIERILVVHPIWTREIIVDHVLNIGQRIQVSDIHARGVKQVWRDYVQLAVVADRIADDRVATIRACMGSKGVENRTCVEYLARRRIGTRRKGIACQPVAEIASAFRGIGHGGNIGQGFPYPGPLIVAKDECLVLLDGAAEKSTELISLKSGFWRRRRRGKIISRV